MNYVFLLFFNVITIFSIFLGIKILRKKRHKKDLKEIWRKKNIHNNTFLNLNCDISKIIVGTNTYGPIHCLSTESTDSILKIGNYVSIARGVKFLLSSEHPLNTVTTYPFKVLKFGYKSEALSKGNIIVGDDVWIGENAIIHSGVTIGQGAVVGAGAVVTKNVPPYAIVVGFPAKILRYRFDDQMIKKLLSIDLVKLYDSFEKEDIDDIYSELTDELLEKFIKRIN